MANGRTAIILDLDRVLFDTKKYWDYLGDALEAKLGIPRKVFDDSYEPSRLATTGGLYNFIAQAHYLAAHLYDSRVHKDSLDFMAGRIRNILFHTAKQVSVQCVYPDADQFLEMASYHESAPDLFLVSHGDFLHQQLKISSSALARYFAGLDGPGESAIFVTQARKGPFVADIARRYDRAFFYDDMLEYHGDVAAEMRFRGLADYPLTQVWVDRKNQPQLMDGHKGKVRRTTSLSFEEYVRMLGEVQAK